MVGAVNQASPFFALGHIWVLQVGRRTMISKAFFVLTASSVKHPWASWRKNATRASWANMSASHVLPVRDFLKTTMGAGCWAATSAAMAIAGRRMLRRHLLVLQVSLRSHAEAALWAQGHEKASLRTRALQNLSAGPRAQHLSRESSREVSAQGTGSRSPVCDLHAELRCAAFSVARRGPRTKYKLVRACMAQVVLAEAPA